MIARIFAGLIIFVSAFLGYHLIISETKNEGLFASYPFRLGLDLSGGSHLLYKADVSGVQENEIPNSMDALRDVIERRVNLFGVGEPVVLVQTSSLGGEKEHRLSVELPGVTDISEAIEMIGKTPFLEFRTQSSVITENMNPEALSTLSADDIFTPTELTGKYLKRAILDFNPTTGEPLITLQFNEEGAELFEEITKNNIGKPVAILLDGGIISAPIVQQAISGGTAQITGIFTPQEAKELVGRLNSGALPVPIELISTQTVGATLGGGAVEAGVKAATIGFIAIVLFLIAWYRLPGLLAALALCIYVIVTLVLYKLIPVTLTAAGIAGFIISIGLAVDANILIFERFREERMQGKTVSESMSVGFARAWLSIRDANTASLIVSAILFWFGSSLIKGFALTLGLGVLVSLLSAITITKVFLKALPPLEVYRWGRFLYMSGFRK